MTRRTAVCWSILCLLMCFAVEGRTENVPQRLARQAAWNFMHETESGARSKSYAADSLQEVELKLQGQRPFLYRYGKNRFVMVAADSERAEVVAYGNCDHSEAMPDGIRWLAETIGGRLPKDGTRLVAGGTVEPMLASVRHQSAPYNLCCPYYISGDGTEAKRTKVGCVATALEQIVTYHRYPAALKDTLYGWTTENYKIEDIAKGTPIDYDHILPCYEEGNYSDREAEAVAKLSYYCGVAAHMNWGVSESGAQLANLVTTLKNAFGYPYVRHLCAYKYSLSSWQELVDGELEAHRPILYAGYTSLIQGHAFVVDGKDERGFYHINWGYGGNYDGYYDLTVLNTFENPDYPTEEGRWTGNFCLQEMVVLGKERVDYDENDGLEWKGRKLRIDSVRYSRLPDGNGYVTVDLYAHNLWPESVSAPVELFTFEPGAENPFRTADYVGITELRLPPGGSGRMTAYCRFSEFGKRVFAVSEDSRTFLFLDTLDIVSGQHKGVSILRADTFRLDGNSMRFCVDIRNNSTSEWAGNMITYSLFEGEYTTDGGEWRQWRVLNLAPDEEITDTVVFSSLKNGQRYTFVVRNPWLPALTLEFVMEQPTKVSPLDKDSGQPDGVYLLDGRSVREMKSGGIYLVRRNGKTKKLYYRK